MLVYELRHAESASAGPPARTQVSTSRQYDPMTQCCRCTILGCCLVGNCPGTLTALKCFPCLNQVAASNIFVNIIILWVGLISQGPMVTIGFFRPIHGFRGLHHSDWGQTNIWLRCESMLIALAWVACGGSLPWAVASWLTVREWIVIGQILH